MFNLHPRGKHMPTIKHNSLPPRVQAALDYIDHTRWITQQFSPAITPRALTPLEQSVETAALRTLQSYFLGEMDYGDAPPVTTAKRDDDDQPPVPQPQPR
jgi:hypothetical protein